MVKVINIEVRWKESIYNRSGSMFFDHEVWWQKNVQSFIICNINIKAECIFQFPNVYM